MALFDRRFFSGGTPYPPPNRRGTPYLMPHVNAQRQAGALNGFAEFRCMGISVNILGSSSR